MVTDRKPKIQNLKNWDYYIERVKNAVYLTAEQKKRAIEIICKLREIFGEAWLENAVKTNHWLIVLLGDRTPNAFFWILEFGEKLKKVENVKNFKELLRKLKNAREFSAANAELEVAAKLKRAGIDVELYPKIDSEVCDLKAKTIDSEFFIEVTALGPSVAESEASKTFELVRLVSWNFDIEASCKIHEILSAPEREKLERKIKYAIKKVKKEGCCRDISEVGVIDCFICPKDRSEDLSKMLKEKGLKRTFEGPPYSLNAIERIKKKIQKKTGQLPKNKPGVIIIFDDSLLGWTLGEEDYRQIANELGEILYDTSRLMLAIVIDKSSGIGSEASFREMGNLISLRKLPYGMLQEDAIIIKNKNCEFPINEKILNAFLKF